MINSSLLLAVQSVPSTPEWSPAVGLTMILCNLLAIAIGYWGINKQNRGKGPALPVEMPGMFKGFGVPELLATASFGHLLGAGVILGLGNAGVL
ncbi:MAG: photosystem I reaction center subunit PsaK [Oscillatoriaceae cyanobacterium Prado104]|jgi:photosystem I subunit 10|nr:photosystem I reaction center subunit PsaK [Oscillatoriaceae cyanobacterium Prado104]